MTNWIFVWETRSQAVESKQFWIGLSPSFVWGSQEKRVQTPKRLKVSAFVSACDNSWSLERRWFPDGFAASGCVSSPALETNECRRSDGRCFCPTVAGPRWHKGVTSCSAFEHFGLRVAASEWARAVKVSRSDLNNICRVVQTEVPPVPSGGPQRGGAAVLPGWVPVEGAPVLPGAGAAAGDDHQVRPLSRPEWKLEGSVRPCRTPHFSEQVPFRRNSACSSNPRFLTHHLGHKMRKNKKP